jgi:DNA helicase-2/ATP-dependent DNA helicase PcrA
MDYYRQNREEMRRVIQTEVDVSLEKDGYILIGKVDLLLGGDGKLELLDFKSSARPRNSPDLIAAYERQLCTYAHILERRHNRQVDRLLLYWTAEPRKEDALMVLPYDKTRVEEAGRCFDRTVRKIQAKDFAVAAPPERTICKECDLRLLCGSEGVIEGFE